MEQELAVPDPEVLRDFWTVQRVRAHFGDLEEYLGRTVIGALIPPAWAWGSTREEADAFARETVAGGSCTVRTPAAELAPDERPVVGTASILCDGHGRPVALLTVAQVREVADVAGEWVEECHRVLVVPR